ncbi:transglycosylase SLT domain-containing protein [Aquirufa nivalisilvae]|uniref:lytic transglycosylase domain-containing protein n=1 Tax=Aquirufa nivalisilvae TaxID=2516557 RepID=UPI0022A8EEBC|nr:lytic transglycosylase domain-containing protein [Aquirufa nivalisilvae]MCZ2482249.1 transglycosylase SLT domain-containing protein [Aquirufa nivalisilvae]
MNKKSLYSVLFLLLIVNSISRAQVWNSFKPILDELVIDSLAQYEQGSPTAWMIDPALIEGRLKQMRNQIPLPYNFYVHQFVEYFAFRKSDFTQRMLEKRDLYFPIYEKYLKQYNLPDELKYLSLIESGLDPKALSNKGAGGLWQFMPYTARGDFGLRVDSYIDERFDPERATEAASKYLRQLYRIFGDWHLALAAYNTGPGNVKRAIRNCKGSDDFWGIYPCLPKQTRAYVPQFIAMAYMMNYHWDHAIHPETWASHVPSDTLQINGYLNLSVFASLAKISMDTLKKLNPHVLTHYLPKDSKSFVLKIPKNRAEYFQLNRKQILDSAGLAAISIQPLLSTDTSATMQMRMVKVRYRVKKGETIYEVARKFEISVFELKRINRLRRNRLKKGQNLFVLEKQWFPVKSIAKIADTSVVKLTSKQLVSKKKKVKYYLVRSGDTLSDIADKHDGLTVAKIKKLNRLRSAVLKPGMRLRIS